MENREIELTAYCALYCGDCLRYRSKGADLARDLKNELGKVKFSEYAEVKKAFLKEFEHYQEFSNVLRAIAELQCRTPCRAGGDGCLQACEIKNCVQEKNFQSCWQCNEYVICPKLEFLKPMHGDTPKKNLEKIKRYGLEGWAEQRGKCYPWL